MSASWRTQAASLLNTLRHYQRTGLLDGLSEHEAYMLELLLNDVEEQFRTAWAAGE